ncbi:MAG: flavodoxin [Oscillospiraceae bacterium]|nr:flavodoxin [Oscillospiraceae bacterium]
MWAKAQYNLCERFRLFNLEERNRTQNTFLYGVTPSVFKGLQRRATVYYPIWWYIAPTIINTFLESYDFSGKTIILFATSGGSGFGKTVDNLKCSVSDSTVIKEGKLLNGRPSVSELQQWVESLGV